MSIGRVGSKMYQRAYSGNRSFGHEREGDGLPTGSGSAKKTAGTVFGCTCGIGYTYFNNPCLYPSLTAWLRFFTPNLR
jgi:hypothetical protein